MAPIILASASPRRKQLLQWAEIDFDIIVADTDESFPQHLSPAEAAAHIAAQKAWSVLKKTNDTRLILAADTIVVLDNQIIGKPKNRAHAINTLMQLSGQTHQVITGVCMLHGAQQHIFTDTTQVHFHALTENEIHFYVDKYQPFDKAGAYAIQEWIGVVGIKKVEGDFYNVMGLPVSRVVQALKELGFYK